MKSYVAKTTINFVDFEFYIRPGDLLVHDLANHNRLTVYRNGQIVKVVKQNPLGVVAFLKNKFIEEVAADTVVAPEVILPPVEAPGTPTEPKKPASKPEAKLKLESKAGKTESNGA